MGAACGGGLRLYVDGVRGFERWGAVLAAGLVAGSLGCTERARATVEEVDQLVGPLVPAAEAATAPSPTRPAPALPGVVDMATVAERVRPAVVTVLCRTSADDDDEVGGLPHPGARHKHHALGSGFVLEPEGVVVTNEHVVHGAEDVRVRLQDGRELPASVTARDARLDVALLAVRGAQGFSTAILGSSRDVRIGDFVLAIGNPFGLGQAVTFGVVSALARDIGAGPYDDFIQTDAAINPGSSGGPLFDTQGRVIGINTVLHAHGRGIGFAIPIDDVREVLGELRSTGHVARGRIGVGFQELTPDLAKAFGGTTREGALLTDVEADGPAGHAGLRPGDVVTSFDGSPIAHASELARELGRRKPGQVVRIVFVRGGKVRTVGVGLVPLVDPPADLSPPSSTAPRPGPGGALGAELEDAPGGGAIVESVDPDGPADEQLEPGDVILEVDGHAVKRASDLTVQVAAKAKPSTLLVRLRRGPAFLFATVPLAPGGADAPKPPR
jgi:serine protease Do